MRIAPSRTDRRAEPKRRAHELWGCPRGSPALCPRSLCSLQQGNGPEFGSQVFPVNTFRCTTDLPQPVFWLGFSLTVEQLSSG